MALLVGACAAFKPRPADPGLRLLAPAEAGFSATLTQALTFSRGEASMDALAVAEIGPERVKLAVLSPLGNRVLALDWDGKDLKVERDPSLPAQFPAELILRDLQLAYWDAAALRKHLPRAWRLEADAAHRSFFEGRAEAIRIDYEGDPLKAPLEFKHRNYKYQLSIRPVKDDD